MDQKALLDKLNKEGMKSTPSGLTPYHEASLKIVEVDTDMAGESSKYQELKKWNGAILILTMKVGDGELKGQTFRTFMSLFKQDGNIAIYPSYKGKPASPLYDIVHAIKQYDEKQWTQEESDLFIPKNLLAKKFKMEIKKAGDNIYLGTQKQKAADEKWLSENKKGDEAQPSTELEDVDW